MKKIAKTKRRRLVTVLGVALRSGEMVHLTDEAGTDDPVRGYVVGLSDDFVLVHLWEPNVMCLNGYLVLAIDQLQSARPIDEHRAFPDRALRHKGITPQAQPDILLVDLPGVLSSAGAHFPLLTIELRNHPNSLFVGRIERLTARSIRLREVDPDADWGDVEKLRFKDITRVGFGGGYEEALWLVNRAEGQIAAEGGSAER